MKHGNYYLSVALRCFALLSFVCLLGCHASRRTTETKEVRESSSHSDSVFVSHHAFVDTVRYGRQESEMVASTGSGEIFVQRDSLGQPEKITFHFTKTVQTDAIRNSEATRNFFGLDASRRSESSGALDSVDEKKEETEEKVDASISLERIIGPWLLGLVLLYFIYIFIADIIFPWIRQKRTR